MHGSSTRRRACGSFWLALALVAGAAAAQTKPRPIKVAPAFSAEQLLTAPTTGWWTNGGTLYNQRYSPLARIDRTNVARLKPKWRVGLNGSGNASKYSGQGQPLVYDGVIYMVTGADDVFAVDVDSGHLLWTYEARLDPGIDVVCCGWSSRGLALGDGKVYVGQLDGRLIALDQRNGKVVWSTQAERWQDGFSITAAPLYPVATNTLYLHPTISYAMLQKYGFLVYPLN